MAEILVEPIEGYALSSNKKGGTTLFSKIGIIGCGKEGQSIARIASWHGVEVVFLELSEEKISKAILNISNELDERIEGWGLTSSEKKVILSRIKGTLDYKDLSDCEFVIEAIRSGDQTGFGSIKERKKVFKNVESVVKEDAIIATNSTTIIITELASELRNPERCISLHFFVSSPEAKITEVMRGLDTSDEVYDKVCSFVKLVDRDVIPVEESAGLVSVRLFITLLNEACQTFMEGVTSKRNIDKTMQVGFGMRFGPFEKADIIGLSKISKWMDNLYEEFGNSKYKPSPLIRRLVRAKRLGKITGEGFYQYDEDGKIIGE